MVIVEVCLCFVIVTCLGSDCVLPQLVTGKIPYPELRDIQVTIKVPRGGRPPKPRSFEAPGMSPGVWKIAKKCWHQNGEVRPDTKAILQSLEKLPKPGVSLQNVLASSKTS